MTFLPVVERELRVASRRRTTPLVRMATAAGALLITAWVLIIDRNSSPSIGEGLFTFLAWLLFLYAGIVGTQVTADCISEEKREGTLGLLFLTDLKGYDVVFGKLVATSIHFFYGMLAVVPVMAIPFLLGGISHGQLWRVVLVSVNLLFFSLSIGILASTLCRRDSRAQTLSVTVALLMFIGVPLLMDSIVKSRPNPTIADLSSPAAGCVMAFDDSYVHEKAHFWMNAALTQMYSWTALGLACWLAPRCWQDEGVRKSFWSRWRLVSAGQSRWRHKMIGANPFQWRASRLRFEPLAAWLMLGVMAIIWSWQYWEMHHTANGQNTDPATNVAYLIIGGIILKSWLAAQAGRALGEDRRSGALELLLSTHAGPADMVRGQERALWRNFALPFGILEIANLLCLKSEMPIMHSFGWSSEDRLSVIGLHTVFGVFLVLDAFALAWTGMWHGFIARKPNRSAAFAMFRVVAAPVLAFLLILSAFAPGGMNINRWELLGLWCVLGVVADVLAFLSKEKLLSRFRSIAAEGYRLGWLITPRRASVPMVAEAS